MLGHATSEQRGCSCSLRVLSGVPSQKQGEVAGTGAEQQCSALQDFQNQPQTPPKRPVPQQGAVSGCDFPGCWIQPRTRSQLHQETQLQDSHSLTTVNAFSSLHISKTKICFYTSQPPMVLHTLQHQFAAPRNTQAPQSQGDHLSSLFLLNRKTIPVSPYHIQEQEKEVLTSRET